MTRYSTERILNNKIAAINSRNKITNDLLEELYLFLLEYDKEILKADDSFRKDFKTKTDEIINKYRGLDTKIRFLFTCSRFGRISLKVDIHYSVDEHSCQYAECIIHLAMVKENGLTEIEKPEYLSVFNRDCILMVKAELVQLNIQAEDIQGKINKLKGGDYHEFL